MSQLIRDVIAAPFPCRSPGVFWGFRSWSLSGWDLWSDFVIAAGKVREVGIRIALGATPACIVSLVVFQSIRLSLIGILAGLLGALTLGRSSLNSDRRHLVVSPDTLRSSF